MSKKTPNIGLALNGVKSEDTQMTFREWRLRVNGEDNDSNMEILDTEIGAVKKKMTELEGQSLSDEDRLKLAKIKDMVPATADGNGEAGFVPAPQSGDQVKYLRGDGTWGVPEGTSKPATENADGLMSKEDKQKLDQFASADQYAKKDDVPKNVETDTTLTKAATPADAKAVGDRIGSLTANDVGAMPVDADVVKTVNGKQPDQNGDIQIAATGGSNIHVGSDNPPDDTYEVWIDPNGEPTEIVDQYAREQLQNKLDNTTTAEDIGALPSSTAIPSKTSDLQNDSGFVAGTDATLTGQGMAADAKATGDALSSLKSEKVAYSDALTLEEIEASTNLSNKVTSAEAMQKMLNQSPWRVWRSTATHTGTELAITLKPLALDTGLIIVSFRQVSGNPGGVVLINTGWLPELIGYNFHNVNNYDAPTISRNEDNSIKILLSKNITSVSNAKFNVCMVYSDVYAGV